MKKDNEKDNIDIEIVIGDDSELKFSEVEDSIKTLRPKDKIRKENIIIPKINNNQKKHKK